jgi:hypothetical protein
MFTYLSGSHDPCANSNISLKNEIDPDNYSPRQTNPLETIWGLACLKKSSTLEKTCAVRRQEKVEYKEAVAKTTVQNMQGRVGWECFVSLPRRSRAWPRLNRTGGFDLRLKRVVACANEVRVMVGFGFIWAESVVIGHEPGGGMRFHVAL